MNLQLNIQRDKLLTTINNSLFARHSTRSQDFPCETKLDNSTSVSFAIKRGKKRKKNSIVEYGIASYYN